MRASLQGITARNIRRLIRAPAEGEIREGTTQGYSKRPSEPVCRFHDRKGMKRDSCIDFGATESLRHGHRVSEHRKDGATRLGAERAGAKGMSFERRDMQKAGVKHSGLLQESRRR